MTHCLLTFLTGLQYFNLLIELKSRLLIRYYHSRIPLTVCKSLKAFYVLLLIKRNLVSSDGTFKQKNSIYVKVYLHGMNFI